MLKSYFSTALRALKRNWNYTVINVVGLTFGLACCLMLFMAIRYELSYDRHHANADHTYRMITYYRDSDGDDRNTGVTLPALAALRTDFPELKHQATMVYELFGGLVKAGDNQSSKFLEDGGVLAFVEPDYFRLFNYQWKEGNPQTAVKNPNTVVLSERMAHKYFGNADPVGKSIRVENKMDFVVTGVVQNPPATTNLPFEVLLSFASLKQFGANGGWDEWKAVYSGAQIYLTLPPTIESAQMEKALVPFVHKYMRPEDAKHLQYELQPLTNIHFDARTGNSANRTVSKQMIWSMALIGMFILITACVNFINLATAQAIHRAKEVGVRKVLGSSRTQLVRQFLGETGLLTGLAVGLAFFVAYLSLPYVSELLDIKAATLVLFDPGVITFVVFLAVLTTVLAGSYPALVLSGYQPVLALRGRMRMAGNSQLTLRRSLIVFQFAISQMLIIGTIIAYSQMKYFRSADLGYDKDAILTVQIPERKPGQLEALKAKLTGLSNIRSMSYGLSIPSSDGNWWTSFTYNNDAKEADFGVVFRFADTSYVNTYGLKLIAGRMYQSADTTREVVVNESLVKKLGIRQPKQIIGKYLTLGGGGNVKKQIVGVVKDFNTFSLHQQTNPSILTTRRDAYHVLGIKLSTQQGGTASISRLIGEVETTWNATFPDFVFKYEFLDQTLANFYRSEERMYALFRLLAGIAIFIGCLGLYGVVAFMAESRTKEVGIRKVLGATTTHIVGLFSADFVKLVLIALLLASPIAWYVMNKWLSDFPYKIDIAWWMFALAGVLAVSIALLTVSIQSIKAALANPVKSLRSE
ncbi:ABC transporter permease [Spirosoma endophyticum]|uniref:MacB-like core domain-containing protein n=1 Tax=Spirosoma endophyticum TaxID=662367 RepID=A0A1I1VD15_9BACT|nr:ABC transporter permease [Spirosoma endophyticum]SFD80887.1 MacB-like core domain-containing protein [Spirosoma endophyticum]